MAGDAGPGRQGVSGGRDRRADTHEEPLPDTGRGDPQQPAVRHAGPRREGQCHVQALQGPATSLPRPRRHHRDHGRRPRHHHPLARFLTRTLVRKAQLWRENFNLKQIQIANEIVIDASVSWPKPNFS